MVCFYGFQCNSSAVCESLKGFFLWFTDCLTIGIIHETMVVHMTWVWTFFNNYSNHPRMCVLSTLCGNVDKHSPFDIYIYIYVYIYINWLHKISIKKEGRINRSYMITNSRGLETCQSDSCIKKQWRRKFLSMGTQKIWWSNLCDPSSVYIWKNIYLSHLSSMQALLKS